MEEIMADAAIAPIRPADPKHRAAIVFVHGFTGSGAGTWNNLVPPIAADPALASWDCWTITYGSSWLPDIVGIWTADADLGILAQRLATDLGQGTLARYEALVLIAHSMGGLIVQKSLVDQKQIAARTRVVILFGTPSGGLVKARTLKFWKRQLASMAQGGEFITKLRADWTRRFAAAAPFSFLAVAGERDQFVPPKSSLEPFPMEQRAVIAGNHVTMIHPPPSDRNVVDLVVQRIAARAATGDIGDSALRAIELGDFQRVIKEYLPHAGTLDSSALVRLAIALDGAGRRDEAYKLLAEHQIMNSDVMGTLAGRLKRNWLLSGRRSADAEAAETHYAKGYELAIKEGNLRQAYYHGINLAFLKFVFRQDRKQARRFAREVLDICDRSRAMHEADEWLDATTGEAKLILGDTEPALAAYRSFVNAGNDIWKIGSTYLNARTIAADLADRELARKLGTLFGDPQP
jgi:pimeloyl-ACP methyl ester carboxylesterase